MRKKKNPEQKCGMKEWKIAPNLKSLIERFSNKMAHHFFC